jgi:hypothetical protein
VIGLSDFGLSPIHPFNISFEGWEQPEKLTPPICPGMPLTFTHYALAGRERQESSIGELHLKDYVLPQLR